MAADNLGHILAESTFHAFTESIKLLPFLFAAFFVIEIMEYRGSRDDNRGLIICGNNSFTGPIIGAAAGCIPQCGFAAAAGKLWTGGRISTGTMMAVFISTSDEALILLAGSPDHLTDAAYILLIKMTVAAAAGYIAERIIWRLPMTYNSSMIHDTEYYTSHRQDRTLHDTPEHRNCACSEITMISAIISALIHALKLMAVVFVFSAVIDIIIHMAGEELISSILMSDTIFQPIIAAAVGLIPGCAPSVLMTQLYMEGFISFSALTAGLISNAGIGLLIVRSVPVAAFLFSTAVISSFVIQIVDLLL